MNLEHYLTDIAKGDQQALALLHDAVSARLFGILLRILRDRALAEDALQETLVKVWNDASTFDARYGPPLTWLNNLARDQALDMLRRTKTQAVVDVQIPDLNFDAWQLTTREYSDSALELEAMVLCLKGLSAESQACIVGMYCEGYTQEELSEILQQPACTIKSLIRRGLASLKECLDNEH